MIENGVGNSFCFVTLSAFSSMPDMGVAVPGFFVWFT